MRDVVWVMDPETMRFTYVSPSVERLRGWTAEEIVARPVTDALTPEAAELVRAQVPHRIADFLAGRGTNADVTEIEQPCKDGSTVWTEVVSHYRLNLETGKVEVVGVSRDISARKRAEQALAASRERVKLLSGILPICASCRRIRDEGDVWQPLEEYVHTHSEARFSHGVCPDCFEKLYPQYASGALFGSGEAK
jgi:PAS domain S-box-containing protein